MVAMMADLAIWMKTGPSSMLRAMDRFERRQIGLRTKTSSEKPDDQPLRVRAAAGAAVWALTIVFLALGGAASAIHNSSFWRFVIGAFVSSWTVWLLYLLHRIARRT
jgi:hypothetical protein